MPETAEKPVETLNYEQAMLELEAIVAGLEGEQNSLEASIRLFERGQALIAHCSGLLEGARLKVQKLAGDRLVVYEKEEE